MAKKTSRRFEEVAVGLSRHVVDIARRESAFLVSGDFPQDEEFLRLVCEQYDIPIHYKPLPVGRRSAVIVLMGDPVIVLDEQLRSSPDDRAFVLAHQMACLVLGTEARSTGFTASVDTSLQGLLETEFELMADLLALHILLPDGYLNRLVEESVYVPARKVAKELSMPLNIVAARLQLYRASFGYTRSLQLTRMHSENLKGSQENALRSPDDPGSTGGLAHLLPRVAQDRLAHLESIL